MPFNDYKSYTKEEVCKFLDFLFLTYFSKGHLRTSNDIQCIYRDFEITPLTERMLGSLEELKNEEKKGKKTDDKS